MLESDLERHQGRRCKQARQQGSAIETLSWEGCRFPSADRALRSQPLDTSQGRCLSSSTVTPPHWANCARVSPTTSSLRSRLTCWLRARGEKNPDERINRPVPERTKYYPITCDKKGFLKCLLLAESGWSAQHNSMPRRTSSGLHDKLATTGWQLRCAYQAP